MHTYRYNKMYLYNITIYYNNDNIVFIVTILKIFARV